MTICKITRASQDSCLVTSTHPAERIKSISRLMSGKKNIQDSGSSGRLKEGSVASFLLPIVQNTLRSFVAFTSKFTACLITLDSQSCFSSRATFFPLLHVPEFLKDCKKRYATFIRYIFSLQSEMCNIKYFFCPVRILGREMFTVKVY